MENLLGISYHFSPYRLNVFLEVWSTMDENLRQESIILNILRSIYYLKLTDTDSVQGSADIIIFLKKKTVQSLAVWFSFGFYTGVH